MLTLAKPKAIYSIAKTEQPLQESPFGPLVEEEDEYKFRSYLFKVGHHERVFLAAILDQTRILPA